MNIRNFSLSMLLFPLAILSCWLVWYYYSLVKVPSLPNSGHPDAFIKQVTITRTNELGRIAYVFYSPSMFHFSQNDRTTFVQPHLTMNITNQQPWQAYANQGEALNGSASIELEGNVRLMQAASYQHPPTSITTTKITLYPKEQIATTDQFISAIQPNIMINSIGMRLNLPKHTINLLSQVHGYYVPKK